MTVNPGRRADISSESTPATRRPVWQPSRYVPGDLGELTLADLDDAHDDDEGECQELASGEDVLDPGGPSHAGTVHPREQH